MMTRIAVAAFVLGSALGVGAMYMSEQWRSARSVRSAPREVERTPQLAREIAPVSLESAEFPADLSLEEIYDRVSHAS
jgi:hypothetical protein